MKIVTSQLRKDSYLSPASACLDINVVRDARPYATIMLDLGIPNFTVFSIKFPLVEDKPSAMSSLIAEAVHTLLDEVSAFMLSLNFEQNVIVGVYAAVLACFKGMTGEADTNKSLSAISKDPIVKTFSGSFKLPMEFVNETYEKVVTAAGKTIKRPPVHRHLELTYEKPQKTTVMDARTVIKNFRSRSLKSQPSPMYIVVYDMMGNARGTIPLGNNFKNDLLNKIYPKGKKGAEESKIEFSPTVKFDNDIEMKTTNAEGIPKSIFVGDEQYTPVATISDDMALYASNQDEYIVKFTDGRCVAFTDRPTVESLKDDNYPVPTVYTDWTSLPKAEVPESSDENEAVDERGTEVIEGTETESNPIVDLKPDDDKNEQLEEGVDEPEGQEKISAVKNKKADHIDENGYWAGEGGAASGILPICTSTGRICLAWRSSYVEEGDTWGTIGGACQRGLSPEESAKKELAEEVGFHGSIRLIPAFVFTHGKFKYFNYLGLVSSEFSLNPMGGGSANLQFTDETDAIAWMTWEDLQNDLKNNGGDYHSGLRKLLQQSGNQIHEICEAASNKSKGG